MEGQVYVCGWKQVGARVRVWVKKNRRIAAEGPTFAEADETLWSAILRAYDDGENVREYDPPAPDDPTVARYLRRRIVSVTGNTRAESSQPVAELFDGGVCPECRRPRGARTPVPRVIDSIESGYDGCLLRFGLAFSEAFLALLNPVERRRFEWRRVERRERSRTTFFELICRPTVPRVAVRGFDFRAWRCSTCRRAGPLYCFGRDVSIHRFVCEADLPRPLPSVFAVGNVYDPDLCLTRARWRRMLGRAGARGLVADDVGVVAEAECDREPPRAPRAPDSLEVVAARLDRKLYEGDDGVPADAARAAAQHALPARHGSGEAERRLRRLRLGPRGLPGSRRRD